MFSRGSKREETVNNSFRRMKFTKLRNVFFASILLLSFHASSEFAQANENEKLQTIYHIYSNKEYIGMLSDEEKLEQLKKEKIAEAAAEFEEFSLTAGSDLSIIPERVFNEKTDDNKVIDKLRDILAVETEATGIQVNDKVALFVKDQESYDSVIRKLKLQAVSQEELDKFEKMNGSNASLPALKENETRIIDIVLTSEVKAAEEIVSPLDILTVDEAVSFLNKGTLEEKKYTVQSGDVISKIAKRHNMTTKQLLKINEGLKADSVIQIGDEINVTYPEPYVEVEVLYAVKEKQKIAFEKIKKKDASLFKGNNKVTQKGADGEKLITKKVRKKNGQVIGQSVEEEKVISEPIDEITVVGTKVIPSRGTGTFKWPAVGGYVSSKMGPRWGRMHRGIDIARPSERSILAADNGIVVATGRDGSYGNKVVIDHQNGYRTLYAHLASIDVKKGQTVPAGTKLGVMGSTGRSTGIHLHFEVTKNGQLIDPLSVLKR